MSPADAFQLFLLAAWFSVSVLCISQHKTIGPYSAEELMPSKFSTLPIAVTDVGGVIFSVPVALLARAYGWKITLMLAGFLGAIACGTCALGLRTKSVELYLLGSFLLAGMNVAGYLVRFAAAESIRATTSKERIIGTVLVGSAVTGSFGPQLVHFGESLGPQYSGVYAVAAGLSLLNVLCSLSLRSPRGRTARKSVTRAYVTLSGDENEECNRNDIESRNEDKTCCDESGHGGNEGILEDKHENNSILVKNDEDHAPSRMSLYRALLTPHICVGVICSASAMYSMLLIMSATPGAMAGQHTRYGFGRSWTETTIQLHIVAMFVPGLVTGDVMKRLGRPMTVCIGALCNLSAVAIGLLSTALRSFVIGLVLVGIGWNLTYIGGTKIIIDGYAKAGSSPSQIKKIQGINESIAQCAAAIGAVLAGFILDAGHGKWSYVMWSALPSIVLSGGAVVFLGVYTHAPSASDRVLESRDHTPQTPSV